MRGKPGLIHCWYSLVSLLLLDAVVASKVEAFRVVGLEVRIGRGGAKVVHAIHEVVVKDGNGEVRIGVFVKALRHQDDCGEVHRRAPEPGQQITLYADVADVFRIRRGRNGRDGFAEQDGKLGVAIDVYLGGLGVEIAGGQIPVLTFAAVWRQLYRGAVGPMEGLVNVQHRLHVVIARRNGVERADRVTRGCLGYGNGLARGESIDCRAEDQLRAWTVIDLHPRLGRRVR